MSEDKKREDASKALLNMGDKYTGAPSETELEFNYDPPRPQMPVSTIYNRQERGITNPLKQKYGPDDTYETMAAKDYARENAGMLTPDEMENLFSEAQERQYQQKKGGKSRRRKSRKSRKSRKNRRKTYRRKN
jgi:peptide subunit release factor 1 (eRF1)